MAEDERSTRQVTIAEFDQIVAARGEQVDFWASQLRMVTEKCGEIDATCALVKVLTDRIDPADLANMLVVALKRINERHADG